MIMFISSESWLRENHKRQTAKLIINQTHTHLDGDVQDHGTKRRRENSMFIIVNVYFRII